MPDRWKPNVTVAAIVQRHDRFLLVEEHTRDGLRLNTPAGHLDPAETPLQACVREVLEEAAYDFTPTALVGVYLNRFLRTLSLIHILRCRRYAVYNFQRPHFQLHQHDYRPGPAHFTLLP